MVSQRKNESANKEQCHCEQQHAIAQMQCAENNLETLMKIAICILPGVVGIEQEISKKKLGNRIKRAAHDT